MEYLTHWIVTHTVVFMFGIFIGWRYMIDLQKVSEGNKIQAVTDWSMTFLTLKNMLWMATLFAAIANSFVFKKAKGRARNFKKGLLSTALFLKSTAGDITSFSTKQKDINKDETTIKVKEKEEDNG